MHSRNWIFRRRGSWHEAVERISSRTSCDVLLALFDEDDPEAYARKWNERLPDLLSRQELDAAAEGWASWYRHHGIDATGWGVVVLRKRRAGANRAQIATVRDRDARLTASDWLRGFFEQG